MQLQSPAVGKLGLMSIINGFKAVGVETMRISAFSTAFVVPTAAFKGLPLWPRTCTCHVGDLA